MGPLEVIVTVGMIGLVLSVIVAALGGVARRDRAKVCPGCGTFLPRHGTVCKHCGHDFATRSSRPKGVP